MKQSGGKWIGFWQALVAAIIWGVSGSCSQFLFEQRSIGPEWLVTARLLLAGIILLSISAVKKEPTLWSIWRNRTDVLRLLVFGIVGITTVQYTYYAAINASNAATATVLQYIGPVFIMIFYALKYRRWPSGLELGAIALAVAGTFLLVTGGKFQSLTISNEALAWGLAAALTLAFYSIQPVSLLKKYKPTIVLGWAMTAGGIVFSFVRAPWQVEGTWDIATFSVFAFVVLMGSLLAFYYYLSAVQRIGAQTTSLLASAEPLSATLLAVWWLHVPYGWADWIGTFCILATIFLLTRKEKKAAKAGVEQQAVVVEG